MRSTRHRRIVGAAAAAAAVTLLFLSSPAQAFTTPQSSSSSSASPTTASRTHPPSSSSSSSSSALDAFGLGPWNLNKGENASPFGFDLNAEVWNGRVAQVSGGGGSVASAGPVALVCDLLNWRLADYHHELMVVSAKATGPAAAAAAAVASSSSPSSPRFFLTFHFLGFVDHIKQQVSFAWVFLQESITGKGMLEGIERGDHAVIVSLGLFCMLIATLAVSFVVAPPPETKKVSTRKIKAPRPDGWSDTNAFQRAKSVAQLLDPSRKVDDLLLNFNDGRPPFGLKKNAETWNGRIAMISFLWVFAQELIERKGLTQGIENGDTGALASLVAFLTLVTGFTGILVSSDDSGDFVERVVGKQALYQNAKSLDWQPKKVEAPYEPLPVASLTPDAAVSDPPTYDQYQRELERALRAMNGEAAQAPAPRITQPAEVYPPRVLAATSKVEQKPEPAELRKDSETFTSPQITLEIKKPDMEKVKEMVKSIPTPTLKLPEKKAKGPATFKVDGYRFKDTTRQMVVENTSPHPSGSFSFNPDTTALIKSSDEASEKSPPPPPTAFKGNPSPHPVEGFKFGETTKEVIQSPQSVSISSQEQQQPQQVQPPPDYASAEVVQAVSTPYRPAEGGSYLDALNKRGNTEQPFQSTTPPSYVEQEESAAAVATSSRPRVTTGSYLDALETYSRYRQDTLSP